MQTLALLTSQICVTRITHQNQNNPTTSNCSSCCIMQPTRKISICVPSSCQLIRATLHFCRNQRRHLGDSKVTLFFPQVIFCRHISYIGSFPAFTSCIHHQVTIRLFLSYSLYIFSLCLVSFYMGLFKSISKEHIAFA